MTRHRAQRLILIIVGSVFVAACGHRYFKIPRTSDAHECFGRCAELQGECRAARGGYGCTTHFERCVSVCPGAVEVTYDEWLAWTSVDAGEPNAGVP